MTTLSFVQLPADGTNTGKRVRNITINDGSNDIFGQVLGIGDPNTLLAIASVSNALPGATDYGLSVRQVPTAVATGSLGALNDSITMSLPDGTQTVTTTATGNGSMSGQLYGSNDAWASSFAISDTKASQFYLNGGTTPQKQHFNVAGFKAVKLQVNGYTSGTSALKMTASSASAFGNYDEPLNVVFPATPVVSLTDNSTGNSPATLVTNPFRSAAGLVVRPIMNAGITSGPATITATDPSTGSGSGFSASSFPITGTPTTNSYKGLLLSNGENFCSISIGLNPTTDGALFFEQSFNTTNLADGEWIVLPLRRAGEAGAPAHFYDSTTFPLPGDSGTWQGSCTNAVGIRVRYFAGTSVGSGIPLLFNARVWGGPQPINQMVTVMNTALPVSGAVSVANDSNSPLPIKNPIQSTRYDFHNVIAGGVDTNVCILKKTGAGMAVSQTGGNLVITTGTTVNSETIVEFPIADVTNEFLLRAAVTLSQRIANQNFFIELVDLVFQGAYTINSTTQVTLTTSGSFTSADIGKKIWLTNLSSVGVPGLATITSIVSTNAVCTVVGWPASGSGTLEAHGLNGMQLLYNGTVVTNVSYDTFANGWTGGATTATINTTASPGHVITAVGSNSEGQLLDQVGGSIVGLETTRRASRIRYIPSFSSPVLRVRVVNGTTAPASTTTFTLGFIDLLKPDNTFSVNLNSIQPMSANSGLPVEVLNSLTIGGTVATTLPAAAALANAQANPTAPAVGAFGKVYNGATWDNAAGCWNTTTGDTGAKSATGNGTTQTNFNAKGMALMFNTGAFVGGSTPTITYKLQFSPDGGTNFFDIPGAVTAAISAAGPVSLMIYPGLATVANAVVNWAMTRTWRVVWTITGAPTSITITAINVAYIP